MLIFADTRFAKGHFDANQSLIVNKIYGTPQTKPLPDNNQNWEIGKYGAVDDARPRLPPRGSSSSTQTGWMP